MEKPSSQPKSDETPKESLAKRTRDAIGLWFRKYISEDEYMFRNPEGLAHLPVDVQYKIAMRTASGFPRRALLNAQYFLHKSYAHEVLKKAAKKDPWTAIHEADGFLDTAYAEEIMTIATEAAPQDMLNWAQKFFKLPWMENIILMAVEKKQKHALYCFHHWFHPFPPDHADFLKENPDFQERLGQKIIELCAPNNPKELFKNAGKIRIYVKDQDFLRKYFVQAIEKEPILALLHAEKMPACVGDLILELAKKAFREMTPKDPYYEEIMIQVRRLLEVDTQSTTLQ